ncbi:MAG: T9SS type A sorting domain-containing protein [Bacteroidetes bacterium]|nr:T9SS type A sorting domain-containing protein [Bacteroidota bacterium]
MKKIILPGLLLMVLPFFTNAQCTTTNASSCVCETTGSTNCDLLPDIYVARPPLLVPGSSAIIEYSQSGNGANDGRLRISVSTPNIGHGPLEVRTTNRYICGTDTITGTAPATCTNTGLPPKQLVVQRVYTKNGNAMTYIDRNAGSMTYHPTHGHMHVDDWGVYSLRIQTNDPNPLNWPVVANGAKLAFCLMDYGSCSTYGGHCVDDNGNTLLNGDFPNYGLGGGQYNCSPTVQGISSGYTDIYYQSLDGMWIDIPPGTCNGTYMIVVQLDPYNYFLEEDETNNILAIPYTLTQQVSAAAVSITPSSTGAVCASTGVTLNATGTAGNAYLWSNGATTQNISVNTAGTYTVTVTTQCGVATSSPYTVSIIGEDPATTDAAICGSGSSQLSASATGATINWYDSPSGGNLVGSGPTLNTPVVNATTTYYAEATTTVAGFSGFAQPTNNTIGAGGYFTGTQHLIFDAFQNFTLASVKVYAQSATTTTVELRNSGGVTLNSMTVSIPSGASRITLNWNIPAGSNYQITRTGSASLYRNNAGVSFPYTIPNYLSIKNSSAGTGTYYFFYDWEITTPTVSCVSSRVPATLTVNTLPVVSVSGNTILCEGGNTTLTASGADTYNWTASNDLNTTTGNTVIATPSATATYTVTGTAANGCTASENVTVTVNPLPVLTTSSDATICAGTSATLNVNGADTYNWSPSTGLNTTSGVSVIATPAATTTYTVIGANSFGCVATADITVSVNPLPVVSLSNFSSICSNAALLTLSGGSPAGGSYSGNGVSNGQFNPAAAGLGTHTITYSYTDGNGCAASATKNITVNNCNCITPGTPGPIAGAAKVCAGEVVTYTINNNPNVTSYNWMMPATATIISGQGTNSVSVQFAGNFTSANICVTATNACGTSQARCKSISKKAPISVGNMAGNLYGNCNATVNYSVPANANASSYTWTVPASCSIVSGQGTNAIVLSTPTGFVSGQVCVTAFNGCVNSAPRCVNIYGAPPSPAVINGPATVCAGQTNVTYSVPVMYSANYYKWTVPAGSTIVSGQGTTSIVVNFGTTVGKIGCTAKNDCGDRGTKTLTIAFNCRESNPALLNVYPNPTSDKISIVFSSENEGVSEMQLLDLTGRVIKTNTLQAIEGINETSMDLSGLSKGVYMLNLIKNEKVSRIKIVLE